VPRPLSEAELERLHALQREQGLFERLIGEVAALVLLPGAGSLARHRPVVVFEDSRQHAAQLYGYSAEDYFGFFGRLGYRLLDLFGRPFGPADWTRPRVPYYRIALPRGGGAEARVIQALPGIVRAHLSPAAAC